MVFSFYCRVCGHILEFEHAYKKVECRKCGTEYFYTSLEFIKGGTYLTKEEIADRISEKLILD